MRLLLGSRRSVGYQRSMSLTKPPGPLSTAPAPHTNYRIDGPAHRIFFQAHPRRYRAELNGRTIFDTTGGHLLHESNILPVLYVPLQDIDRDLVQRTEHTTHCPFKGDASYWSVTAGERTVENALWAYEDPKPEVSWLKGFASLYWNAADTWLEEDEVIQGHWRDPYHRVDVRRSSRPARITANGMTIAETDHPVLVFETNLPVRVYVRAEDVRTDLLTKSDTHTICPYKGRASYWTLTLEDGTTIPDAAWTYDEPLDDIGDLHGLISFLGEGIETHLEPVGTAATVPAD
jgi:uncharacterized protein (DUF427 family)